MQPFENLGNQRLFSSFRHICDETLGKIDDRGLHPTRHAGYHDAILLYE
jgi:hypothetical protein